VGIKDGEIYVTASPCYNCFKLIANSGIKTIYYDEFYREDRIINHAKEAGIELISLN
jgi:dCMP deaminase